jgi:hypothetical protein
MKKGKRKEEEEYDKMVSRETKKEHVEVKRRKKKRGRTGRNKIMKD